MVEQSKNKKEKIIEETKKVEKEAKAGAENVKSFFSKFLNLLPEYLRERMLSALILIPLAILIIYASKTIFTIAIIAVAVLMAFEWITIVKTEEENNMWRMLGLLYIILPCASLIYIRGAEKGADIVLWLFLIVWATDIAGLIVGSTLGGPKIAPSISPKKTWSGAIGAVLASMFVGLLSSVIFKQSALFFIIFSAMISVIEQVGDFTESKFKRIFGVKDSGNIIPGHGGVMDRVDGFTFAAPVVALVVMFSNTVF